MRDIVLLNSGEILSALEIFGGDNICFRGDDILFAFLRSLFVLAWRSSFVSCMSFFEFFFAKHAPITNRFFAVQQTVGHIATKEGMNYIDCKGVMCL